jgi:hypothetical protein
MPIVIKDYTWSETEGEVHVVVPLKGVKAAKADVYSTATYIKVNFPPYIFEADLLYVTPPTHTHTHTHTHSLSLSYFAASTMQCSVKHTLHAHRALFPAAGKEPLSSLTLLASFATEFTAHPICGGVYCPCTAHV